MNWPGFIRYSDDAELSYVSDQSEWDSNADLHHYEYDESDYLVDSSGEIYSLVKRQDDCVKPERSGRTIGLQDILGLVKAHAAQRGSCCVAKIYAPTISEAFKIIESLNEA